MAEHKRKSNKGPVEHILTFEVRNAQPELASYIKKRVSHGLVSYALEKGLLHRPEKCEECGKDCRPRAHHSDYTRPLSIKWLCHKCHGKVHANDYRNPHQCPLRKRLRELDKMWEFDYIAKMTEIVSADITSAYEETPQQS